MNEITAGAELTQPLSGEVSPIDETMPIDEDALYNQHKNLVVKLKRSLRSGHTGFIKAGKFLYDINKNKTYMAEDSAHRHTFADFCDRSDIPLPGTTKETRTRNAYSFIKVYEQFCIKNNIDHEILGDIGWSKLFLIAGALEKGDGTPDEWLEKARELSSKDLVDEIKLGHKTLTEILSCKHDNVIEKHSYRCPDCRTSLNHDPRQIAGEQQ